MVNTYVKLIQTGRKTLENVPERYRAEVEARLAGAAWQN